MTWLIVGGLLILAFAPVLWLMPTKRDRQLVKLREQARREGLTVEVTALPKTGARAEERVGADGVARDVTRPCSVYQLPASKPWRGTPPAGSCSATRAVLRRSRDGRNIRRCRFRRLAPTIGRAVAEAVDGLDDHCLAIEVTGRAAGWYWLENTRGREAAELVGEIAERLRALASLQTSFELSCSTDE